MKYKEFIAEADKSSKNLSYAPIPEYQMSDGQYQLGVVSFGSSLLSRSLLIDNSYKFDSKLVGGNYAFARIKNSLTKIKGGSIINATLAKFKPESGVMWLAEDEDGMGNIIWSSPFKYKKIIIQSEKLAKKSGWENYLLMADK